MRTCHNCHCQLENEAVYCPVCGTAANTYIPPNPNFSNPTPVTPPPVPHADPYDHTDEYLPEDIGSNKLVCMIVYLLGFVGIIIGLLAAKESEFTAFHIRQSMKFTILEVLLGVVALVLFWTFLIPIAASITLFVLQILKYICFTQVCSGKAKEPPVIRSISFLK